MTTLNIGGIGFIQKYDNLTDAFAASNPNDTILIHNSITIDSTIQIDHDINIEADEDTQIFVEDGVVGIELIKGQLNLKNLVALTKNQSVFIYKTSSDDAEIKLTNVRLLNYDSGAAENCFPAILIQSDSDAYTTDLIMHNVVVYFIDVITHHLEISDSRIGSMIKRTSKVFSLIVNGKDFNLSNIEINARFCNFVNLQSNGNVTLHSDVDLNGFTINPLPIGSRDPRIRDNELIDVQQEMGRFNHNRDMVALAITGSGTNILRVNIQNANLNREILADQAQVLNIVAWFVLFNCDANISNSIISHTDKLNVSKHGSLALIDVTDNDNPVDDEWLIQDPQY